ERRRVPRDRRLLRAIACSVASAARAQAQIAAERGEAGTDGDVLRDGVARSLVQDAAAEQRQHCHCGREEETEAPGTAAQLERKPVEDRGKVVEDVAGVPRGLRTQRSGP